MPSDRASIVKNQPQRKKKLLDRVSEVMRRRHYSIRTEESYINWMKRFMLFHGKRHPREMGIKEIEEFLSYLAVKKKVSRSTQNQAFNAILFLYRDVLKVELDEPINAVRAARRRRLPVVMTREEVQHEGQRANLSKYFHGSYLDRLKSC